MTEALNWKYPDAIISCEWLRKHHDDPHIRIYDCTQYLHYTDEDPTKPYDVESGLLNYQISHIPKASFLDLQGELSDVNSPFKFTLPNLEELAERLQKKGIGDPYQIILYSANGLQWATRIWWMIYVLGFHNVSILDGGLQEWKMLGFPVEEGHNTFDQSNFKLKIDHNIFVGKFDVLAALNDQKYCLINSLTEDIYCGNNSRYGRRGRIPNSINIPFHQLLDESTGKLKNMNDIKQIYKQRKVCRDNNTISYCGGGIAASLDAFILFQLGFENIQIYDNSLSEWAMDTTLPMEFD